jgi:hypothetical protein
MHLAGEVMILDVAGELNEALEELDLALQRALAEEPRGVVCDLSSAGERSVASAQTLVDLATWQLRNWPGTPVGLACPDVNLHAALCARPRADNLVVAPSMSLALTEVLATPGRSVAFLRLTSNPSAPYAARMFVARTLREWQVEQHLFNGCLVAGELVTHALQHAGPDIELSVAEYRSTIRVAVRDPSAAIPSPRTGSDERSERGLLIVSRLSTSWGVLPTPNGGKVVWAVLD